MNRKKSVRPDRGFTILEMLVVLAIMGIILAIAIPRLGPTPGLRLDGEFKRIDSLSQIARTRAVATGLPQRIAFVTSASDNDFSQSTIFVMEPFVDDETNELKWAVASEPNFLDQGVFIDRTSSSGLLETTIEWNKNELEALVVEFSPSGLCTQTNGRLHLAIGIRNGDEVEFLEREGNRSELLFTRLGAVVPAPETDQP